MIESNDQQEPEGKFERKLSSFLNRQERDEARQRYTDRLAADYDVKRAAGHSGRIRPLRIFAYAATIALLITAGWLIFDGGLAAGSTVYLIEEQYAPVSRSTGADADLTALYASFNRRDFADVLIRYESLEEPDPTAHYFGGLAYLALDRKEAARTALEQVPAGKDYYVEAQTFLKNMR